VNLKGEGVGVEVRQPGRVGDRTFEITFIDLGVRAYVVTFG